MNVESVGCLIRNADGTCQGDPPIGVQIKTAAHFWSPFCDHLVFDDAYSTSDFDVHGVWVTLIQTAPKRIWEVRTLPGQDVAVCLPEPLPSKGKSKSITGERYYHLSFQLWIEEL